MKTQEILDKYRKIIAPILKCESKDIKFFIYGRGETYKNQMVQDEIGSLNYEKDNNWSLGTYVVKIKNTEISRWKLYEMPHCCAFMISCNVTVNPDFRNKRIGTILNQLRQDIGRILNYSSVICTDIEKNTNQRKLLETNGWKDIHDVVNKRTKNRVYISVINI